MTTRCPRLTGTLVAIPLLLITSCSRDRNELSVTNLDAAAVADACWASGERQAEAEALEAATATLTEAVAGTLGPLQILKTLSEPEKKALAGNILQRLHDATGILPAKKLWLRGWRRRGLRTPQNAMPAKHNKQR